MMKTVAVYSYIRKIRSGLRTGWFYIQETIFLIVSF